MFARASRPIKATLSLVALSIYVCLSIELRNVAEIGRLLQCQLEQTTVRTVFESIDTCVVCSAAVPFHMSCTSGIAQAPAFLFRGNAREHGQSTVSGAGARHIFHPSRRLTVPRIPSSCLVAARMMTAGGSRGSPVTPEYFTSVLPCARLHTVQGIIST